MFRTPLAAAAALVCLVLLLPVLGITAVLVLFTSCVRAISRGLEPPSVPWTDLMVFDRRLGWKPRPDVEANYLADRDDVFRLVTDREGWPGHRSLDDSEIVVIGDSFAFGYGIDTHRSFSEVHPELRTKAVGAPGYSMVHGVRLMEQLGCRLDGKLVLWFAFPENDLQDNLSPEMRGYRMPFVRPDRLKGGWEIVDSHIAETKWHCSDLTSRRLFPSFCVPGPQADRAYSACNYLVGRAQKVCARAGARLVLVTIPYPAQLTEDGRASLAELSGRPELFDKDLPDRRIADCCQRHGVPMVAGKDLLTAHDYKRREGIHWNRRGHRRVAEMVRQLHESFVAGTLEECPLLTADRPSDSIPQPPRIVDGPEIVPTADNLTSR